MRFPIMLAAVSLSLCAASRARADAPSSVPELPSAATPAPATTPAPAQAPVAVVDGPARLDVGLSLGWNNPGGIYGAEGDFRLGNMVSVGFGAGKGAWGLRLTPQLRLYPLGIDRSGLFLEGGCAMNFGGSTNESDNGELAETIQEEFTPVADLAVGYRAELSRHFWIGVRAGYGISLRKDNTIKTGEGSGLLDLAVAASQPGGPIVGVSMGIAAF